MGLSVGSVIREDFRDGAAPLVLQWWDGRPGVKHTTVYRCGGDSKASDAREEEGVGVFLTTPSAAVV